MGIPMSSSINRRAVDLTGLLLMVGLAIAISVSQAASPPAGTTTAYPAAVETPEQSQAKIAKLIEQLGDKQYLVRQAAQNELSRIGPDAFDALTQAESNSDIEICSRAKYLVQQIRIEFVSENDSPQVKQILRDYDRQEDDRRLYKMQELAMLPRDLGLPALCRLVRFEKSPLLSKHAALLILGLPTVSTGRRALRGKSIEINLASCTRPGAHWLRGYIEFIRDPMQGTPAWDRWVNEELAAIEAGSDLDVDSVLLLEKRFARFLDQKLQRHDLAVEMMRRMLAQETGDPFTLKSLVDWFVQARAWDLIDDAARRFEHVFASDPLLMYTAAHAKQAQGQQKDADALAEKAFQLVPVDLKEHHETATQLMHRGIFDYSEREFRHVIAKAPPETSEATDAQSELAEMLHDEELDLAAVEVLRPLVTLMKSDKEVKQRMAGSNHMFVPAARMHFFYACDAAAHQKLEERQKELDEAVAHDPKDADVLIALYESSRGDQARRKQAVALIRDAEEKFRAEIAQQPNNFSVYNELAWTLGNTIGDFDAAIQYSEKSIAIVAEITRNQGSREEGGYIDTLAHCYAGKGDFETAVKYQARAHELEPHTLQIARALEQFTEQLENERKETP